MLSDCRSSSPKLSQAVIDGVSAIGGRSKGRFQTFMSDGLYPGFFVVISCFHSDLALPSACVSRLWPGDHPAAALHGLLPQHTGQIRRGHSGRILQETVRSFYSAHKECEARPVVLLCGFTYALHLVCVCFWHYKPLCMNRLFSLDHPPFPFYSPC